MEPAPPQQGAAAQFNLPRILAPVVAAVASQAARGSTIAPSIPAPEQIAQVDFHKPSKSAKGEWETPKSRRRGRKTAANGKIFTKALSAPTQSKSSAVSKKATAVEEDTPRFPVGDIDSRYGRAGEWPFEEDYTYRIERDPTPINKKPDPILFRPKPPPKVVVVHEPPNVGWTPGFRNFPREILRFIFTLVCEDFAAVRQVRRVCSAWRKLVSTLPIHVSSPVRITNPRFKGRTVLPDNVRRLFLLSPHIVSLDLGQYVNVKEEAFVDLAQTALTLRHLSCRTPTSQPNLNFLSAFTGLESLEVYALYLTTLAVRRPAGSVVGFPHVHTLVAHCRFSAGVDDCFPSLTSLTLRSLRQSTRLNITNPAIINQLTYLCCQRLIVDATALAVLASTSLRVLEITDSHVNLPSQFRWPITFSFTHLNIAAGNFTEMEIARWSQLVYLDVSGSWTPVQLPSLPNLEVLRSVGYSFDKWIYNLHKFPRLRQVIARPGEFIREYANILGHRGIAMVSSKDFETI